MSGPNITLTALLQDIAGHPLGSAANPCKLCIALCGYGPYLPKIAGTSMLARVGPIYLESTNGSFSTPLWGNDVITPSGTYYTVALLDGQGNVVQCAAYTLTGSGTQDLSGILPTIPPYGFPIGNLVYRPCTGSGRNWTAPGKAIVVTYNGINMPQGASFPINSYTLDSSGTQITLNFVPDTTDRIDAFCVL